MKNALHILVFILLIPFIYSDEGINIYQYGKPIIITEVVENTTGESCLDCVCNLTIYNPEPFQTISNISLYMTNNNNGIYNATIQQLPVNINDSIYPVVLICNNSYYRGISTIKGIKVEWNMFNFTALVIIPITLSILCAYYAFKFSEEHVFLKWTFLLLSILFFISFSVIGNIIAIQSGVPGLTNFFDTLIYLTGFIFIAVIFYMIKTFITFNKNKKQSLDRGY